MYEDELTSIRVYEYVVCGYKEIHRCIVASLFVSSELTERKNNPSAKSPRSRCGTHEDTYTCAHTHARAHMHVHMHRHTHMNTHMRTHAHNSAHIMGKEV